ncbi:hypothetical protein J4O75_14725 [Paenibacillus pabuli]
MGSKLDAMSAELILVELVNEGILEMVFAVDCMNNEESHVRILYDIEELKEHVCPYCGEKMDFNNIRVGFRRKRTI